MKYRIIISGFGGQGVLTAGKILTRAAELSGYKTLWMPSQVSEMRGETASCNLIIEKEPYARSASGITDILIAMNRQALKRFGGSINGMIITDECLENGCELSTQMVYLNTDLCSGGGIFEGLTNVMMIGALLAETDIINSGDVHKAIVETVGCSGTKKMCGAVEYGRQRAYKKRLMREIVC